MTTTDYRLPTVRDGQETTFIPPHQGFAPEAIAFRSGLRLWTETDAPTPVLAHPERWTEQALCLDDYELFDEPSPEDLDRLVRPLCGRCPVQEMCLSTALEEERWPTGGPLPVDHRAGVRGGATPHERVRMVAPAVPATCGKGHRLSTENAFLDPYRVKWMCNPCRNEEKRARRARRAAA